MLSLNNQAQTVNCTVERHISIKTKAHLEDGSQTFTHGDVVDMFDDVLITLMYWMASKEALRNNSVRLITRWHEQRNLEIWQN